MLSFCSLSNSALTSGLYAAGIVYCGLRNGTFEVMFISWVIKSVRPMGSDLAENTERYSKIKSKSLLRTDSSRCST